MLNCHVGRQWIEREPARLFCGCLLKIDTSEVMSRTNSVAFVRNFSRQLIERSADLTLQEVNADAGAILQTSN